MDKNMKLFKRISQIPTIQPTAADVHLMLMAFSMAYMDEIVQSVSPKLEDKAKLLENLGFINAAEIRQKESEESRYDEYKTLCEYKEMFPDSIFLKVDDFKKVLEKYGLVAGLALQYTGTIPDDCLELIHKVRTIQQENNDTDLIRQINIEYQLIVSPSNADLNRRYSFLSSSNDEYDKYIEEKKKEAAKNALKYKNFPFIRVDQPDGVQISYLENNTFLIAATPDKMKNPLDVVKSSIDSDPIVFQLLPYDIVVVHAKWGDEANDEAFTNKIL